MTWSAPCARQHEPQCATVLVTVRDYARDGRDRAHNPRDSAQCVSIVHTTDLEQCTVLCTFWGTVHGHCTRTLFMDTVKKKSIKMTPENLGRHKNSESIVVTDSSMNTDTHNWATSSSGKTNMVGLSFHLSFLNNHQSSPLWFIV